MAKAWATLYDYVLPDVPGCPTAVADQALREAAIEFYDRSGIVTFENAPVTVVDGTATYGLTAPAGYTVARVQEMFMGDLRLVPVDLARLSQMYIHWQSITGAPQYYIQETTDTFRLVPEPDQNFTDTIVATVVIVPSRASTQIAEDWVWENYAPVIAAGALARLTRMQQKPWMDLQRSVAFEGDFRRGWMSAKDQSDRGGSGAPLQVRLKRIF